MIQLSLERLIVLLVFVLLAAVFVGHRRRTAMIKDAADALVIAGNNSPASAFGKDSGSASKTSQAGVRHKASFGITELTAHLPLSFEPNVGQLDRHAEFLARGAGYNLFLTSTSAVLQFRSADFGPRIQQQAQPQRKNQ